MMPLVESGIVNILDGTQVVLMTKFEFLTCKYLLKHEKSAENLQESERVPIFPKIKNPVHPRSPECLNPDSGIRDSGATIPQSRKPLSRLSVFCYHVLIGIRFP